MVEIAEFGKGPAELGDDAKGANAIVVVLRISLLSSGNNG